MAEIKNIESFTKVSTLPDNTGNVTTYFNDNLSGILKAELIGIDPQEEIIQSNFFNTKLAEGILTIDELKIPKDLEIVFDENGHLILIGDNANKYDIDPNTGHLIFTEP